MKMKTIYITKETNYIDLPQEFITKNSIENNCLLPDIDGLRETILQGYETKDEKLRDNKKLSKLSPSQLQKDYGVNCNIAMFVNGVLQIKGIDYIMIAGGSKVIVMALNDSFSERENVTFMY